MMIRVLIVEDEPLLMARLSQLYRELFEQQGYHAVVEQSTNPEEARSLAKAAGTNPYDFVSLDVNLGSRTLTGLDVLSTLGRFHSAWMVSLLTGAENDPALDEILGKAAGKRLRKGLRPEAYSRFPAERLLVVEKPGNEKGLKDRLEQIVAVYREVSRTRFIFRPIDVVSLERVKVRKGERPKRKFVEAISTHWQIRYNCGDIRTLPDKAGFKTLHQLLRMNRAESLTPEEALFVEPKIDKPILNESSSARDPVAGYFESRGIHWLKLSDGERTKMIQAALSRVFNRYIDLRDLQEEDDLSPKEEDEFDAMVTELGPLAPAAETAYIRRRQLEPDAGSTLTVGAMAQQELHIAGGNYDIMPGRRGEDSPDAQAFRARMKRVKDCLRENGFAAFATHLDDYLTSTGASWSYNPPQGFDWTT